MSLWKRGEKSYSEAVEETVAAADVKARAEILLDQMTDSLTELRNLILGSQRDES